MVLVVVVMVIVHIMHVGIAERSYKGEQASPVYLLTTAARLLLFFLIRLRYGRICERRYKAE